MFLSYVKNKKLKAMKRNFFKLLPFFLVAIIFSMASCSKDNNFFSNLFTDKTEQIPDSVKKDLLHLREEEKLARDVYLYAYDKYELLVFKNISQAEQRHMDAVLGLLKEFNLPDPASSQRGVFSDSTLQKLYYQLTAKVDSSLKDALIVGCTIEDLDIHDIQEMQKRTDNQDILKVYAQLECGSRNHMRAFYSQVIENDTTYTPQFISQEEFERIINSDHERCGG